MERGPTNPGPTNPGPANPEPTRLTYRLALWSCGTFARVCFRCRWEGVENVPADGPVILASNHESFIDPFLIGRPFDRRVEYLALRKLYDKRIVRWFLERLHTIPVDSEGSPYGVKAAVHRLRAGAMIGIFPEGERSWTGEVQEFKPGLGLLAISAPATVVPVAITGLYHCYGRHRRLPRLGRVTIRYCPPLVIDPADLADREARRRLILTLSERTRDAVVAGRSTMAADARR